MNEINRKHVLSLIEHSQLMILYESNINSIINHKGLSMVQFKELECGDRIYDYVVYTLGGTIPTNFLKSIGIEFDVEVPSVQEGGETNMLGLFLIGDLSAGTNGGSVIWAFISANTAMEEIVRENLRG